MMERSCFIRIVPGLILGVVTNHPSLALQVSTGNTFSNLKFLGLAKAKVSVVQWPIFRLIFVDSQYTCFGVEFRLVDASPCSLGLLSSIRRAWQNKQPLHEELGSQCFLFSKCTLSF